MIITPTSLVFYLIERGLITVESAVDGDLMVIESSSRNRNYKVVRRRDQGYFVKQIQQPDPRTVSFLQREATCYWLANNEEQFGALAAVTPGFYGFDPQRWILVIELLNGENLIEYHHRLRQFPVDVGAAAGEMLASYHRGVRSDAQSDAGKGTFPRAIPWILSAHRMEDSPLRAMQGGSGQVLDILRRYGDFHQALDGLRDRWQQSAFIHGDLKWENCIFYEADGKQRLKIIDWETADFGDAAWDVGAIFQSYLTFWIMSLPMQGNMPLDQALAQAPFPVEAMQPSIDAFWCQYLTTAGAGEQVARALLLRSVQFAAARMLQTAFEYMTYSPQITANALAQLQVSLNILREPDVAAGELLGL